MLFPHVLSSFRSVHLSKASVNPVELLWTPFLTYREVGKVSLAVAVQETCGETQNSLFDAETMAKGK